MSTSMCLCLCSRYSSLCIPTFLLSLLAQRPSTTLFVGWGLCFSSCIRWSTTTGLSTLQKAAASHQRVLVSLWSILDHFEQVLFFSLWCGFRIWFDGGCCLCKLFLIHPRAHPQEARCFRKQLIGTEPITVIVFSQACYQSVFLKWQQLPLIWNDSSPHGSACLSAVRTVAITGDDSEADTPYQYCHPTRVLSVGVRSLKPGPIAWLVSSVCETTACHQAGCAGSESALELSFPFCYPLFFTETICVTV